MTKIVYEWKKTPFVEAQTDSLLVKAQKKGYKVAQAVVFEAITELLAQAHGYRVKELRKQSESKDHFAIYIVGSKAECEKHLQEVKEGKRNSQTYQEAINKVRNNMFFKRLRKNPSIGKASIKQSKFDKLCDDLLLFGISLEVYIDES